MSVFWQELKKIWRPGILAGIVPLGLIYYYMFPSFYIEHFSNGPSAQAEFELSVGWVAQYGTTLEPEERAELDSRLAEEIAKFNRQLEEFPEAAVAGITDYASFRDILQQNKGDHQLLWAIQDRTNYDTISTIQHMLERYDDPSDNANLKL